MRSGCRSTARLMSASGQKQTSKQVRRMSALPPKADIDQHASDVRFVPKADIVRCGERTSLFDHLVGAGKQRLRHGEPECLRGFEIDDKFVLGGCLHREIARLLALADAVGVSGGTAELVGHFNFNSVRTELFAFYEECSATDEALRCRGRARERLPTEIGNEVGGARAFAGRTSRHIFCLYQTSDTGALASRAYGQAARTCRLQCGQKPNFPV